MTESVVAVDSKLASVMYDQAGGIRPTKRRCSPSSSAAPVTAQLRVSRRKPYKPAERHYKKSVIMPDICSDVWSQTMA
ncbi:MAG: hypothetical protein AB7W28_08160 [Armatimonadota bacterium]